MEIKGPEHEHELPSLDPIKGLGPKKNPLAKIAGMLAGMIGGIGKLLGVKKIIIIVAVFRRPKRHGLAKMTPNPKRRKKTSFRQKSSKWDDSTSRIRLIRSEQSRAESNSNSVLKFPASSVRSIIVKGNAMKKARCSFHSGRMIFYCV